MTMSVSKELQRRFVELYTWLCQISEDDYPIIREELLSRLGDKAYNDVVDFLSAKARPFAHTQFILYVDLANLEAGQTVVIPPFPYPPDLSRGVEFRVEKVLEDERVILTIKSAS